MEAVRECFGVRIATRIVPGSLKGTGQLEGDGHEYMHLYGAIKMKCIYS